MKKAVGIGAVIVVGGILAVYLFASRQSSSRPAAQTYYGTYVALGDSVAAGVGLGDYLDASACDRTASSYPGRLAKARNLRLVDLACSGATVPAGILGRQDVNRLFVSPQLDESMKQKDPSLVTVTIGANDAGWFDRLQKCYMAECGTAADDAAIAADEKVMSDNLRTALDRLTASFAVAKPRIVVTGYYQPYSASPSANCVDLNGVSAVEQAWIRRQAQTLDDTIAAAVATKPGITFAPLDFKGHELCSTDPWLQGLADSHPLHPTAAGQAAIAAKIGAKL